MSAEGDATLTLTVPQSAAQPLAEAMALGWLRDTTFLVTLAMPEELHSERKG